MPITSQSTNVGIQLGRLAGSAISATVICLASSHDNCIEFTTAESYILIRYFARSSKLALALISVEEKSEFLKRIGFLITPFLHSISDRASTKKPRLGTEAAADAARGWVHTSKYYSVCHQSVRPTCSVFMTNSVHKHQECHIFIFMQAHAIFILNAMKNDTPEPLAPSFGRSGCRNVIEVLNLSSASHSAQIWD